MLLSKRRLFCTDRQIIFIYGTRIWYEADNTHSDDSLVNGDYNFNPNVMLGWFQQRYPSQSGHHDDRSSASTSRI
jgi:hypothetical protein